MTAMDTLPATETDNHARPADSTCRSESGRAQSGRAWLARESDRPTDTLATLHSPVREPTAHRTVINRHPLRATFNCLRRPHESLR